MTPAATHFVGPLTLRPYRPPVRLELLDPTPRPGMAISSWPAGRFVLIAPASRRFHRPLHTGFATDLLSTLCLATDRPIAVAPAMNLPDVVNPATGQLPVFCNGVASTVGPASASRPA